MLDQRRRRDRLIDLLADLAHQMWSGWMKYLFQFGTFNSNGTFTISADKVSRWKRQSETPYELLSEREKESDRIEARRMISLFNAWLGG